VTVADHRPVPLRPLGFGDVLDGAFKILRAEWRALAIVAGAVLVPVELISGYLQRGALAQGFPDLLSGLDPQQTAPVPDEAFVAALATGAVTVLLAYPLLFGALTRVAAGSVITEPAGAGEAFGVGLRRWPAMLVAWFAISVLALVPALAATVLIIVGIAAEALPLIVLGALAMLLAMPAGVLVFALFVAVPSVIVVEGAGPFRGMRRSAGLIGRRIFPVFGVTVVAGLLVMVISSVLSFIPTMLGMVAGETVGWVIVAAGSIVGSLVTLPFLAGVMHLVYVDGRVRREGLDIEIAASRLEQPPPQHGFGGA
jgi:hypothetical protein